MSSPEKQITENIPEFFFIWDLTRNEIIHLTDTFDEISRNPKEKETLEKIKGIIADDEKEKFNQAFLNIKEGDYFQDLEFKTSNVFNGTKWINMKTYPVKVNEGSVMNVAGQFLDITEKKQRQEKIKKQSEDIEDILHILVHDIRGPLGNIQNIARAQKGRNSDEMELVRSFSALIEKIAGSTLHMMESMIETLKVTSGGFIIEPKTVNLQSFFNNVLSSFSNSLKEKQVTLETEYPDDDITLEIDEVKFRLVIQNLVTNAIKFTPNKGKINIRMFSDQDYVVIEITDTGIGISQENIEKIFEKFSPVRRDGLRGEKSFGLGLSITKKIVELHNGTINVESQIRKGTKFTIQLPR